MNCRHSKNQEKHLDVKIALSTSIKYISVYTFSLISLESYNLRGYCKHDYAVLEKQLDEVKKELNELKREELVLQFEKFEKQIENNEPSSGSSSDGSVEIDVEEVYQIKKNKEFGGTSSRMVNYFYFTYLLLF